MAEVELGKALKDLPNKIQTASLKERKEVIGNVILVLSNPGITDNIVRGICKVVQITLLRYRDSFSQNLIKNLLIALYNHHREWTVKHFLTVLSDVSSQYKHLVATPSTAQSALYALGWSCLLLELGVNKDIDGRKAELSVLVGAQCILVTNVLASGIKKQTTKAYNMLNKSWQSVGGSVKTYLDIISTSEQSHYYVVLGSLCARYYTQNKMTEEFQSYMPKLLESFIKTIVTSKSKPLQTVVESCYPLLRLVTHEQFKTTLLPALQKSMLRNPEVILECVGLITTGLNLDLSRYADDIGKSLISNLHSKDDLARDESSDACKRLSKQCSDSGAIESLLKQIFAVFHGADGKLTVAGHKTSVLQGAGNVSCNAVTGSSLQQLTAVAADHFLKVLEVEVHEKTLCHALDMLSLWVCKFSNEVPMKVVDALKNGLTMKTSTAAVRTSYIECMLSCFQSNTLNQAGGLVAPLLKVVEKSTTQPTQSPAVTEGLVAACMLLKYAASQGDKENNLVGLWGLLFDVEKQLFVSEKFLSVASDDALIHVMQLCERLLLEYHERLNGKTAGPLHHAILHCVTSSSTKVRRRCFPILRRLVGGLSGAKLAKVFMKEFNVFLDTAKIKNVNGGADRNESSDANNDISPHVLVECVTVICSPVGVASEDAQLLALEAFVPSHHPAIVSVAPDLWIKVVKHLGLKPNELIAMQAKHFRKVLVEEYVVSASNENALATAVRINGTLILPDLVAKVRCLLDDTNIVHVTKDDYFTYLTPDGELYDKSVIPGEENNSAMNMKRESKAYTYKDQLEEMQLRRELDEKKKKAGKVKEPQFSQKQIEAMKNQMVKEQIIRARLTDMTGTILNCVSMIQAAAKGNPKQLASNFQHLLPSIINDLQSPLAAPYLCKLYISLRKVAFPPSLDTLASLIGFVTLRLNKPQCDLDGAWESEDLKKAVTRTIGLIHNLVTHRKNTELDSHVPQNHFMAPGICYSFALLKLTLVKSTVSNNETMIHDILQILSEHAKLRDDGKHNDDDDDINLYRPEYLPRMQMFQTLVELICSTSGRIQSQAVACLLNVAASIGDSGASLEEVNVLLGALQNPSGVVRDSSLRALQMMIDSLPKLCDDRAFATKLAKRIWITKFDADDANRELATQLWISANLDISSAFCDSILEDISNPVACIQTAASESLADLLKDHPESVDSTLKQLLLLYNRHLAMIPSKLDEFGREIERPIDLWSPRNGVALALCQVAPLLSGDSIGTLVHFFVSTALGDRKEEVRKEMLTAALKVVDLHGKETVGTLLPVFENFMDKAPKSAHYDAIKQAVVILMGSLARHLERDDPRIKPIVMRLISALSTPSQTVQDAVSNCLHPLVGSVKEEAPGLVNKLLHQLLKSEKYGDRRGAAYGLAGFVKGMGILALKQLNIMERLTDAIQDKKNYKHREGALFAFEMLCEKLGRLFEPYVVHVLPHLLLCFGDSSQYVRTATDDTAKIVMAKLSGHGVKLVLPSLLAALEEDSWRTKTGSVDLLGMMAFCAPKQLSSCLPSIVPKLIEVLSDSHMKVQEAGAEALKLIGSVIKNPEIQAIVPVLLQALQDPSNKTSACLQTLLDTQFVHFIDAPSLALIMPVVQRAFMDRSTETRKMAAQIIGNMYSLTDQKDLLPYLPTIIPGLKTSLLDPVPEVRSVSARALGAMVRGIGETSFEDLLPWLMQTLTSETSSVDRSGAAQGLSEVVGGLGVEKLHRLMPEVIATAERSDIAPHVKDGYIMLFIYMPVVFTSEFTPYIGQIINPILKALADENEYVRDTALKAGQRIVTLYADSAIMLLLPELERGLFDDNWRIRYSSVQLLGDLLYRISGVTGKMSTETASEDDNFGTEQSHMAIIGALGAERRNRVLAGLYMGRSDVALMVRQAALHVWKVVVTNTPRTLREILPTLFGLLLGCLASTSYDKRQVAARTLGDLVRKLGERVLPEIIPILERGLQSDQPDQRQGVCIGLSEIMASTSREMVLTFVNSLVPTVRKALCDPLPEVRQAAAKTFDSLHSTVGVKALDDILPSMLSQLNDSDPDVVECTLDGLRQVMAIKSRVVLPYLVPQLTASPANTKALSILASVAGEALNKYLPRILPALQNALSTARGTSDETQQLEYCQAVVLSVSDDVGIRTVVDTLLENTRADCAGQRRAAATLLCAFCASSRAQYQTHIPQLLRGLIHLCTDSDRDVLQMSWEALNAVIKTLEPKQQAAYVGDVRQAVRFAMSDMKHSTTAENVDLLPGFCLPKGIMPILPIFREAILNGDGDEKEAAAQGLGEVIRVTSAAALQPSVVAITGPLIRILGDRFSWNVKSAVLETLAILLAKVGSMLKQFLPQLQTTFLKALNDSNRSVRLKAATALGHLIIIHIRADPLLTELHNGIKNTDDSAVRETTLQALRNVITPAGDKMSETLRQQIYASLLGMLGHSEDTTRAAAGGCVGALCRWLDVEQLTVVLQDHLFNDNAQIDWMLRQGRAAALSVAIKEAPNVLWQEEYQQRLIKTVLSQLAADRVPIVLAAVRSCGYLFQHLMLVKEQLPQTLLVPFVRTMNHTSNDVKQLLARVSIHLAKNIPQNTMAPELLKLLLPTLVNGTKEKNGYVKANSEIALIAVLRLREGDETQQRCLSLLDIGARESLSDVVSKVLRKVMSQPEGKEEELDDTLLT